MLHGQYVCHQGQLHQLVRVIAPTPAPGMPRSSATYELLRLADQQMVYLRDPSATDLRLAPGCEQCDLPAGYARCGQDGHQGPAQPVSVRPSRVLDKLTREARNGRSCACWSWDCGECGRAMASGLRRPA